MAMSHGMPDRLAALDAAVRSAVASIETAGAGGEVGDEALTAFKTAVDAVRAACAGLVAAGSGAADGGGAQLVAHAQDVWAQACAIWNAAGDAANKGWCKETLPGASDGGSSSSGRAAATQVAWLRHAACELLWQLPQGALQDGQQRQLVRFCMWAAQAWAQHDAWEQAELLLACACRLASSALQQQQQQQRAGAQGCQLADEEVLLLLFDVHAQRLVTVWKLEQMALVQQVLGAARAAAEELAPTSALQARLCLTLASLLQQLVLDAMTAQQQGGQQGCGANSSSSSASSSTSAHLLESLHAAHELVSRAQAAAAAASADAAAGQAGAVSAGASAAGQQPAALLELHAALLEQEAKVLYCLAWAHLELRSDGSAALGCIDALRQLEVCHASLPGVALMALKAALLLGQAAQAEAEATAIAVSDASDAPTCLAVLLELLAAPGMASQLRAVLELVLGRFPDDPQTPVTFTEQALTAAAAANSSGGAELRALALAALRDARGGREAVAAAPAWRRRLFVALHNAGVGLFQAAAFEAALELFTAALEFAEPDASKGPLLRQMALCRLGLQQLPQALSCCTLADGYQPGQAATSFIRLKLLLLQRQEGQVLQELKQLAACSDFSHHMLMAVFKEAAAASALPVAKAALMQLHALLAEQAAAPPPPAGEAGSVAGAAANGAASTPEGAVLRVLVRLTVDELAGHMEAVKAAAAARAAEGDAEQQAQEQQEGDAAAASEAAAACVLQLGEQLALVGARAKALGAEAFAGEAGPAASQQLEWFALCAWNAALHAAGLRDFQATTVLMNSSASLLALLPAPHSARQLRMQRLATLLAAAAALENHAAMPAHTASLVLARRLAGASMAAASKLSALTAAGLAAPQAAAGPAGGAAATGDAAADVCCLRLLARVALALGDEAGLLGVVEQLCQHQAVTPEQLWALAQECGQPAGGGGSDAAGGGAKCASAAAAALRGALHKLLAAPAPDCALVAAVLRALLVAAGGPAGGSKLQLYREAAGILASLPRGAFPAREAAWLAATAWNWGVHSSRCGRRGDAAALMAAALELLPHAGGAYDASRERMAGALAALQQQEKGAAAAEAVAVAEA